MSKHFISFHRKKRSKLFPSKNEIHQWALEVFLIRTEQNGMESISQWECDTFASLNRTQYSVGRGTIF